MTSEKYHAAQIVAAVCDVAGISPDKLTTPRRHRNWVRARQLCWLVIYDHGWLSLPSIGKQFGRDHTTVLYGIREARRRVAEDPSTYRRVMAKLAEDPTRVELVEAAKRRSAALVAMAAAHDDLEKRSARCVDGEMTREWWAANDRRFRDAMLAAGVRGFHDHGAAP